MSIQSNITEIRSRIAAACAECGRDPKEITLVGASKMNDAAACREAIAAGIDVLGENRVQEMTEKLSQNAYDGAPLHWSGAGCASTARPPARDCTRPPSSWCGRSIRRPVPKRSSPG